MTANPRPTRGSSNAKPSSNARQPRARKKTPPLAAVIDRYIAESKNVVHGTKAQVLKTLKSSYLGEIKCSEITSLTLVSFAQELNKSIEPQTCGN